MATLIDTEENLEEDLQKNELMDEQTEIEEPEAQAQEPEEDDIPEKYRGKTPRELIQMHQEAEKAVGRQGSEVGELRKLVDSYIMSQSKQQAPQPEVEDVDWFADPDKALESKLSSHPTIKKFEESARKSEQLASQERLRAKHPDYKEIVQDEGFAKWIQESKIRTKLFIEADRGYDADAADELFSLWKERKSLAQSTVDMDKQARKNDVRRASTGNARGSNAPQGKKIYRRADIIKLINEDPDRYAMLEPDIRRAYAEGRVK